jgi:hypothetical protein
MPRQFVRIGKILILLAIGAFGLILGHQLSTLKNTPTSPKIIDQSDSLGWKTYTNPVFHYSIKYPPEYTVSLAQTYNPPESLITLSSPKNIALGIGHQFQGSVCANNSLPCDQVKLIKTTINGRDYEPEEQYYMNDQKNYQFKLYLDGSQIDISGSFENKTDAIEISNILSTFKFTD